MRVKRLRLPNWWDWFLIGLLAAVGIAIVIPARGAATPIVDIATTAGIATLFFLHGAKLSTREAWVGLRQWKLHVVIFATTFVVFPLVGLALRFLDGTALSHELYLGLLFLCAMPSTVQTSIAFTSIARGNVAAAICSATFSNLLGVFLSPVLVGWLLGSAVEIRPESVLLIGCEIVLPFVAGQLVRRWVQPWIVARPTTISLVDRGSVLLVVYSAFSSGVVSGIWQTISPWSFLAVIGVNTLLLAAILTFTTGLGKWLGFARAERVVYLFCGSKKSVSTGLPIALILFPASTVSIIVLPLLLYHQIQLIICAVIAKRMAASDPQLVPEPA
jgi:sodium/bile acid cotransporter 7